MTNSQNTPAIFTMPTQEVILFCKSFLQKLENLEDCAAEEKNQDALNYFTESYNFFDVSFRTIEISGTASLRMRNKIRMMAKEVLKQNYIS